MRTELAAKDIAVERERSVEVCDGKRDVINGG